MGKKINREEMIGNCYQSLTWGKYCIMSYEGKTDNKHYYKIAFENGNEYVSHWDLIRKGRCEDSITKKAKRAKANYIMQKQRARVTKDKQKEYKTFDFTNKTVLALDLSSTSTGWCILNQRGIKDFGSITFMNGKSKKEIEALKSIKNVKLLEAEYSIEKRLELIFRDVSELLNGTTRIDIVIIEECFLGLSVNVLKVLMQLQGFVLGTCLTSGIEFEKIMPSSWQQFHNLATHRDEIKAGSIANAERIIKIKTIDDIADAINLGIYAVKNLNK